jgi:hypothetical protein
MSAEADRTVLPIRRPPFAGVAAKTLGGSEPDWGLIGHVQPPAGAPNVLLVLIDDAGFGNPGTFGGPIATPNYDRAWRSAAGSGWSSGCSHRRCWHRRSSAAVAHVDGGGARKLKAALAKAQAGLSG